MRITASVRVVISVSFSMWKRETGEADRKRHKGADNSKALSKLRHLMNLSA